MMWWILAVVVVIALPLVLWYRADAADRALKLARERELALKQEQNQKLKEIATAATPLLQPSAHFSPLLCENYNAAVKERQGKALRENCQTFNAKTVSYVGRSSILVKFTFYCLKI